MVQKRVMSVLLVAAASTMVASCGGKVRSELVAGCMSQGASESKCTCLYDKLEDKYGVDSLEAMQKGETILPGFVEATAVGAAQCSGVDPATALKQLGIESQSSDVASNVLGEPVAQGGAANASAQADGGETSAHVQASDDAVIENAIAVMASSETGYEYKDARKVAAGDLNGDGASDAAALGEMMEARETSGFDQGALDEAARKGFANGAFEDLAEDVPAVVEEFYPEAEQPGSPEGSAAATSLRGRLEQKVAGLGNR